MPNALRDNRENVAKANKTLTENSFALIELKGNPSIQNYGITTEDTEKTERERRKKNIRQRNRIPFSKQTLNICSAE